jgi:hypothetical protein
VLEGQRERDALPEACGERERRLNKELYLSFSKVIQNLLYIGY